MKSIDLFFILAITTFLNMGIISIRVSSDIPVQSRYLPLITLFFLLSLFYTFISFMWFTILEMFKSKNTLPKCLLLLANCLIKFRNLLNNCNKSPNIKNQTIAIRVYSRNVADNSKDKKPNELFEKISVINILAFFIMFSMMFISYICIWIGISGQTV